jgi:hypothetical protein
MFKSETILTAVTGGRMLLFFCFFLICWIVTFVLRKYAKTDDPEASMKATLDKAKPIA